MNKFPTNLSTAPWFNQGFRRRSRPSDLPRLADDLEDSRGRPLPSSDSFEFWFADASTFLLNRLGRQLFSGDPRLLRLRVVASTAGGRYWACMHPQAYAHELYEFVEAWERSVSDELSAAAISFPARWLPFALLAALSAASPTAYLHNLMLVDAHDFEIGPGRRASMFRRLRVLSIYNHADLELAAQRLRDWDAFQRAMARDR